MQKFCPESKSLREIRGGVQREKTLLFIDEFKLYTSVRYQCEETGQQVVKGIVSKWQTLWWR